MKIGIIGGGFGRGLASVAARAGHEVVLCSRRPLADDADGRICTASLAAVFERDLVFLAVPSSRLQALIEEVVHHVNGRHSVVHVSRGLLGPELQTVCQSLVAATSVRRVGVLAGPLSDAVLKQGTPGGAIVGSDYPEVIDVVRDALGGPNLRVYGTSDRQGVELAAALTGILLFALGYGHGMGFGPSTLGLLAARGIAEVLRIVRELGGQPETLTGLAGFGDLMAAVAGDGRPEWALGATMAKGVSTGQARETVRANVEGTEIVAHLQAFAHARGFELPLVDALDAVISGRVSGDEAVRSLMSRDVNDEGIAL